MKVVLKLKLNEDDVIHRKIGGYRLYKKGLFPGARHEISVLFTSMTSLFFYDFVSKFICRITETPVNDLILGLKCLLLREPPKMKKV